MGKDKYKGNILTVVESMSSVEAEASENPTVLLKNKANAVITGVGSSPELSHAAQASTVPLRTFRANIREKSNHPKKVTATLTRARLARIILRRRRLRDDSDLTSAISANTAVSTSVMLEDMECKYECK